jgi:hypothetical protein
MLSVIVVSVTYKPVYAECHGAQFVCYKIWTQFTAILVVNSINFKLVMLILASMLAKKFCNLRLGFYVIKF